jgi:heat shock protein 4
MIKRIIGLKYSQIPEEDLKQFPCKLVQGPHDSILLEVLYREEIVQFTPVQVLAMIFSKLGQYVEAEELSVKLCDVVIAIPVYFLDVQRRAVLQAAKIAGFNVIRLVNDVCAAAAEYGIYKDIPENTVSNIAFVDVGHADTTVSIVELKHDQVRVVANAYDRSLGARDFENLLVDHFVEEIKKKYNMDVRSNTKALVRLQRETEKLKKVLSANPIGQLRIECLMNEKDVSLQIHRDEFEEMSKSLHSRFQLPVRKALADSKLELKDISAVEIFGGGSYIPAMRNIIAEVFQVQPRQTLNAAECIARGAAIIAGMMSTSMHLAKKFTVVDAIQFPINIGWVSKDANAMDVDSDSTAANKFSLVFKKFDPTPNTKLLTFSRSGDFDLYASYADPSELPANTDSLLGKFTISNVPKKDKVSIKVKVRHDVHGIVNIETAQVVEEIEYEEQEEIVEEAPAQTEQKTEQPQEAQADQQQQAPQQPKEKKYRTVKKKKTVSTNLPVHYSVPEYSEQDIKNFISKEQEMLRNDKEVSDTAEAKNAVEAYIYQMKDKIFDEDALGKYVDEQSRDEFDNILSEAEMWLYGEGEEATKDQSQKKLQELKKYGDPIENRKKEEAERPAAVNSLLNTIQEHVDFVNSQDEKYAHISAEDRQKVAEKINEIRSWFDVELAKQSKLTSTQNPSLTLYNVNLKNNELRSFARPIINKPKPAPPKEEPKKEEPKKEEAPTSEQKPNEQQNESADKMEE